MNNLFDYFCSKLNTLQSYLTFFVPLKLLLYIYQFTSMICVSHLLKLRFWPPKFLFFNFFPLQHIYPD
ncbi:hypothetical protein HanRHA438_Chr00c06g0845591 [Helianthus annuus]|nr:hypothetical protein HanRHA438_Chr00c06g0845591 [Helianthus annuus]